MRETSCRSCGAADLQPVLSLGETPLANSLLTAEGLAQPEPVFPLDVVFCPACSLVQITETVSPELLFSDYVYFSSFSDTMLQHAQELAAEVIATRGLGPESLVVEIASNDGYLLQYYAQAGVPVLGVDPAANVAPAAEAKGVPTRVAFFGRDVAQQLVAEGRRADVIHALNVLAHVADLNGVVAGMALLLKPGGVIIIETPYVRPMIEHVEFDTIYHEHLCYYSLTALDHLFRRHGLAVIDVAETPIHGGSLRVTIGAGQEPSARVAAMLAEEQALGLDRHAYYAAFGERVEALRAQLLALLQELQAQGRRIAVYGASAKGSTLLNSFGIGPETLEYVVDRSTAKQGHFTPGSHLPIYPPARLVEDRPDDVLLLTWNFADEILAQQAAYRALGGRFIIPIPEPRIV
ncbi:MAG: class I SAM-dependent methyltransferase [Thermomicrobiales bacterium]